MIAGTQPESNARVSVVIPCLNEAETIAECVVTVRAVLDETGLSGEVIVVDNASDDGSGDIARAAGASVVYESQRGYGSACLAGLRAAVGEYLVIADADLTYDFREIPAFVRCLDAGADFVVGNRLRGISPGAMPFLSRVGNPILSGLLNLLYRTNVGDVHCGMRALRRDALPVLKLQATGMEFASEMVIRASREKLDVREVPIELHRRVGASKLAPFRDGWRHLRLILVYSPTFLFTLPGVVLAFVGFGIALAVFVHVPLFGRSLYFHSLVFGCLLVILGVQALSFGVCARAYNAYYIGGEDRLFDRWRARLRLEHGLVVSAVFLVAGLALGGVIVRTWASRGFGTLQEERLAIVAATTIAVGAQIFFTAFLLSIIGLRRGGVDP